MISVTVYKDKNNHYTGFRCDGHAEYAEPGEDIVCSAVSVLTLNTCNAIEALTEDAFSVGADQETGLVDFDKITAKVKNFFLSFSKFKPSDIASSSERFNTSNFLWFNKTMINIKVTIGIITFA